MDKRKKRVKRLKVILLVLFLVFLLLPSLLCGVLFVQLHRLSKEVEALKTVQAAEPVPDNGQKFSAGQNLSDTAEEGLPETDQPDELADMAGQATMQDQKVQAEGQEAQPMKPDDGKVVYLTFDDGPGENTEAILDILKEYQVHASFFVVGKEDEKSLDLYRRIVEEGHTLGMHSYSHDYGKIYESIKAFRKDYKKINKLLKKATGIEPQFYRFPGGSSNSVSKEEMTVFICELNEKGITYFDWNVVSGDAVPEPPSAKQICKNVLAGVKKYQTSVVLLHDLAEKKSTLEALPIILDELSEMGASVRAIDAEVTPVQHVTVKE